MSESPLVLLTNDDGFEAPGIKAMAEALSAVADVVVVAPATEQSACSHALTLHRPMRLRKKSKNWYALDGTTADCVYVALFSEGRVLSRRPELVVSGLNMGVNLGYDVYYSGTVAGAREGAIRGVAGLAVSADLGVNLEVAARACAVIAKTFMEIKPALDPAPLLNVNVPKGDRWPVRAVRLGRRSYGESVEYRVDPRGRQYLWIGGAGVSHGTEPGTDTHVFDSGEIGVSNLPLSYPSDGLPDVARNVIEKLVGPLPP